MFTPLHRELGVEPTPTLGYELLEQAVERGVLEQEDLDWKAALSDHEGWLDEFAKDVAAMANGAGGLIVYGVAEVKRTSAAKDLIDVGEVDQARERALRQAAYSAVRPAITHLSIERLASVDGTTRALVVRVPSSLDAPHLVFRNQVFGAPMRVGRHTEWMQEWQIERAYRARFRGQEERTARLDAMWTDEAEALRLRQQAQDAHIWLLVAATPVDPTPISVGQATAEQASSILREGWLLAERAVSGRNGNFMHNFGVRPGGRRWTVVNGDDDTFVAVGHDGSVTYAEIVGGRADFDEGSLLAVVREELERAVAKAVGIVAIAGRELHLQGPHRVRASLVWWPRDSAIVFAREDNMLGSSRLRLVQPLMPVFRLLPETTEVDGTATEEELRSHMREITVALASQGGLDKVRFLSPRPDGGQ